MGGGGNQFTCVVPCQEFKAAFYHSNFMNFEVRTQGQVLVATYLYFTLFIYLYRYNANSISFYYIFSLSFHFLGKCSKMLTNFNAFIATENFRFFFAESTMFLPRSFALLYYRFEAGYKIKYANTLLYSVKSYRMRQVGT